MPRSLTLSTVIGDKRVADNGRDVFIDEVENVIDELMSVSKLFEPILNTKYGL